MRAKQVRRQASRAACRSLLCRHRLPHPAPRQARLCRRRPRPVAGVSKDPLPQLRLDCPIFPVAVRLLLQGQALRVQGRHAHQTAVVVLPCRAAAVCQVNQVRAK